MAFVLCAFLGASANSVAEPTAPRPVPAPKPNAAARQVAPQSSPAATAVAGFSDCESVEVTGAPPAESICRRTRKLTQPDRCCEGPVEVAVLRGTRVLLRVDACGFVPPECANVHGHGRMDARLRVLAGPPPEVIVVEGGCEMRAMAHGYVPPGVAAWTGCRHSRYSWNGKALIKQ